MRRRSEVRASSAPSQPVSTHSRLVSADCAAQSDYRGRLHTDESTFCVLATDDAPAIQMPQKTQAASAAEHTCVTLPCTI